MVLKCGAEAVPLVTVCCALAEGGATGAAAVPTCCLLLRNFAWQIPFVGNCVGIRRLCHHASHRPKLTFRLWCLCSKLPQRLPPTLPAASREFHLGHRQQCMIARLCLCADCAASA